ncbi:hypothetical protein CAOG_04380 [Capsaspora owczarzaki ATCC 30864]|uniref:SET domain-containing protein n=1 Tax=Capsaspora owczarzaki (strain ATCC 30864) TaxID=595528 RepID=A0A0D2UEW8_CAPO3|nr:hypothetical protein CAOG_04380 [Capsaspora owczarzaki ATCC 30864]KJE93621.1 hypothetical protein CAOG_004380 [Capsaspora owczarzaki ATCC 30864]|eukprot:XP_004348208.2 hypothetical protein CAOG_04380 [Capsaspora owczarzaki ATCC 30864]
MTRLTMKWASVAVLVLTVIAAAGMARAAETTTTTTNPGLGLGRKQSELPAFREFLARGGAEMHGVDIQEHVDADGRPGVAGRGVFALRDLAAGETVLRVPLSLLLNVEHASASPLGGILDDFRLSDAEAMAFWLIYELTRPERASPWLPYLESLPASIKQLTMFYDPFEMKRLQASPVAEFTSRRTVKMRNKFGKYREQISKHRPAHLAEIEFPVELITVDDFLWAMAVQFTRLITVQVKHPADGEWERTKCLVPLADLLNTAPADQINVECATNLDSTHFECATIRPVAEGQELLTPYGGAEQLSNGQLIMDYGVTFRNNPSDLVALPIPKLRETAVAYDSKMRLLMAMSLDRFDRLQLPVLDHFESIPKELLAFARVYVSTPSDLSDLEHVLELMKEHRAINPSNERRALELLLQLTNEMILKYITTIEEDETMLRELDAESVPNANAVNAVVLRLGEKRILSSLWQLLDSAIEALPESKQALEDVEDDQEQVVHAEL